MKNKIKKLRIEIDGLAQLIKNLHPFGEPIEGEGILSQILKSDTTKEIEKAVDSLYLAKAWLGKMLGELGVESPYPKDGTRKTTDDIEETADTAKKVEDYPKDNKEWIDNIKNVSHIEKVDWLREEIKVIIEYVSKWYTHTQTPTREFSISRTNVYNYLCEARFWLGFELQRIKENEECKSS
jgi:hypothetical protein